MRKRLNQKKNSEGAYEQILVKKCRFEISVNSNFQAYCFLFPLFSSLLKATRGDPKEVITSGDKF